MDKDERRRFSRVPFDTEAQLVRIADGRAVSVLLLDLCLQGALVELPVRGFSEIPDFVSTGEMARLDLCLGELEITISMETEVVHMHGLHVGLRCRLVDLDSVTHLRRLVELNLGDPALFQREFSLLG
ncbi:Cyclic diguanosine monophosphate-binding protein PA4608 [Gammaproteobacteria bacterium]